MTPPILIDLRSRRLPPSLGGKAANLRRLIDGGFRVPVTCVIPWEAYERCLLHDQNLIVELSEALQRMLDPAKTYAVRSSANIEDSLEHSFAGQFVTCLDVHGIAEIGRAVRCVWDSAAAENVQQYLDRIPGLKQDLKMGVIVQEMVTPCISGVAFSRNPLTGAAETVVEAVEGSGLRLVQDGCTPHRWIHKWGRWVAQPEDGAFPLHIIQQVVDGVEVIARYLKGPVDLEWVYDGQTLYWVQVREITTIKDLNIYSNRISREVLPGQIKPLIWSINIPLVISQWIKLLTEMIGKNDLLPDELARQFHSYAYFNMGALGRIFNTAGFPSEGLEMMMGIVPKEAGRPAFRFNPASLRLAPRMLRFMVQKWTMEANYKKVFPALEREIREISLEGLAQWSEAELCEQINRHFELLQRTAWYNIHIPILMNMYAALLSKQLQKQGIQPEQLDLMAGIPEAGAYDPERSLRQLNHQYRDLSGEMQARITHSSYSEFLTLPGIEPFQASVARFIKAFGHFSDSGNDFSAVPWREQPELILRMISAYEPHNSFSVQLLHMKDIRKRSPTLRLFYGRTRRFRLYREQVSYQYTYAYGLFRDLFHALGDRLVTRSLLDDWQDIFYLNWDEVQPLALSGDDSANPARGRVADRRAEMEHSYAAELPTVIYGNQVPPIIPSSSERMSGTPTSPGYYSGRVCLVHGIQHFNQVQPGDVLVIPYSDVGWTPLFARAGAVIAESGGILSHSSIVAREYRIPAVLSVDGAMQRLRDGQVVTVDGYKGEVILHKASNQ